MFILALLRLAVDIIAQKIVEEKVKIDQCNWSGSIIGKNFQRIGDYIYQYPIQHIENGTEICPVVQAIVNLGLRLLSMFMQLNMPYKLHNTINFNSAFPNTLIVRILNPTRSWLQINLHF